MSTDALTKNDKYIFKATTDEAFVIKIIGELLNNTIRWAPILIDNRGIFLIQEDNLCHQMIDLALYKDNFNYFKLTKPSISFIINSVHLYKMLKSIKKKDKIELYITESDPLKLCICVDQSNVTFIKISYSQPKDPENLQGYEDPIIMNNKQFQKMKNLHNISKTIAISSKPGYIRFFCDGSEFFSRELMIGTPDNEDNRNLPISFNQNFTTNYITGLVKCAGQSSNVKIYSHEELPLKILMKIGSLGELTVYIKSIEMIEMEKRIKEMENEEGSDSEEETN
jgi:hypothetical protein